MTNEAEERAHWTTMLQTLRVNGWSVAVHNDYRKDGDSYTFWLMVDGEGWTVKGEGRTDQDAFNEIAEKVAIPSEAAARAASPVSAPITLDQAREWRRINWYDSVPEQLDKALAAFANYAAKGVAPVSAEQPTKEVFTPAEVASLNDYQVSHFMHPFTCASGNRTDSAHNGGEGLLIATVRGWICPFCDYVQDWAHDFMKDGSWRKSWEAQKLSRKPRVAAPSVASEDSATQQQLTISKKNAERALREPQK